MAYGKYFTYYLGCIITTLGLVSCAVSPTVVTKEQRRERVKQDWENIFRASSNHNKKSISIYE